MRLKRNNFVCFCKIILLFSFTFSRRIYENSAAILAALFLSATATAATITQEGSGIGKDGEIKVVFEDGKIKNVDILKQQENPVLSQKVFTDLKDEIVKTDSTELDVIAGATYSSLGRIAGQQAAQVAQAAK